MIWQLVRDSCVLDINSSYCYLLLCKYFSGTCAVAEIHGEMVGFLTGFLPPGREDTFFVWQVGVDSSVRGQGIATHMLQELLHRDHCHGVSFIEATVGPSNQVSRAFFTSLAQDLNTGMSVHPHFDSVLFPRGNHEPEYLYRIGPFSPAKAGNS